MGIAFAGTAPFGEAILRGLLDGPGDGRPPADVRLVLSQPDRPAGRGKKLSSPPVAQLAKEREVRLLQPQRLHDPELLELYRELGVTTFVVAAFGQMIREPLLTDYLMLNVHGSILPHYRGAAPIERAIMDGCDETGVDIMRMEAGLDTGPIAFSSRVPIEIEDDAGTVFSKLETAAIPILFDALDAAEDGRLEFVEQRDQDATYAHKITAVDRMLNPEATTRIFHDQVRALSPHIGGWLLIDEQRIGIWRTQMLSAKDFEAASHAPWADARNILGNPGQIWHNDKHLILGTSDGAVEVLELQPPGKRRMASSDWLRGLRASLSQATAGGGNP